MIHPDVEAAVVEIVDTAVGEDTACIRLQDDFAQHLPQVVVQAEQNDSDVIADHRVRFEVYAENLPEARMISRTITSLLVGKQHATQAGLIDPGRVEGAPKEVPYPDPAVAMYSFVVVVSTRAL